MKRRLTVFAAVALAVVLVGGAPLATAASKATYYVALGDSLAASFQPIGFGSDFEGTQGYAEQVFKAARATDDQLRLVKLGCGGETSSSLVTGVGSPCTYPHGSQLSEAVAFLEAHAGQIEFITIDIGGNDVIGCSDPATGVPDAGCVAATMPDTQDNIATVLAALQDAASGVRIVGMSYYNPFLGYWTLIPGPVGESLAHIGAESVAVANAAIVQAFQDGGALVADVAGAFDIDNFSDTTFLKSFGVAPVNVANACNWTWFCTIPPGPPIGPDVHPTSDGYGVIATAFLEVLPA
jgi:lysophospholipase L1-like esterase